jgi:hypothetical protein
VELPLAASIGDNAFRGCTALTEVSLPAATTIGTSAFQGCTDLTTVKLPSAVNIGMAVFTNTPFADGTITPISITLKAGIVDNDNGGLPTALWNCYNTVNGRAEGTYTRDGSSWVRSTP